MTVSCCGRKSSCHAPLLTSVISASSLVQLSTHVCWSVLVMVPNMCWHVPCGTTTYVGGGGTYVGAVHSMWNEPAMHVHSGWHVPAVPRGTIQDQVVVIHVVWCSRFMALTFSMCLNMQAVECTSNLHVFAFVHLFATDRNSMFC